MKVYAGAFKNMVLFTALVALGIALAAFQYIPFAPIYLVALAFFSLLLFLSQVKYVFEAKELVVKYWLYEKRVSYTSIKHAGIAKKFLSLTTLGIKYGWLPMRLVYVDADEKLYFITPENSTDFLQELNTRIKQKNTR
mgnify:FL=1